MCVCVCTHYERTVVPGEQCWQRASLRESGACKSNRVYSCLNVSSMLRFSFVGVQFQPRATRQRVAWVSFLKRQANKKKTTLQNPDLNGWLAAS